jgi:hypothetical protein
VELWRKLGCVSAVLVWVALGFPFVFALAWSGAHCDPVPQCQRANEWHFGLILATLAALAGLTAFAVARGLSRLALRREDEGASAGFFTLAIFLALTGTAIVIVAAYAVLDRVI